AQRKLRGEDAGVLRLVLLQDVGLHGATHRLQGVRPDTLIDLRLHELIAGETEKREPRAVVTRGPLPLVGWRGATALARRPVQLRDALLRLAPAALGAQVTLHPLIDRG